MKELIEVYQRRLEIVNEIIKTTDNDSQNYIEKITRLNTKVAMYRQFIVELEKELQKIEELESIVLDQYEKQWILLIKGQLRDKYPFTGRWHNTLKPLFTEIYGWNPDEDNNYRDYLNGIFNKLLEILLKIKDPWSNENAQLNEIFEAAFYKGISCDEELPIERAIHRVCGLIQCTTVINPDGVKRYELF